MNGKASRLCAAGWLGGLNCLDYGVTERTETSGASETRE